MEDVSVALLWALGLLFRTVWILRRRHDLTWQQETGLCQKKEQLLFPPVLGCDPPCPCPNRASEVNNRSKQEDKMMEVNGESKQCTSTRERS